MAKMRMKYSQITSSHIQYCNLHTDDGRFMSRILAVLLWLYVAVQCGRGTRHFREERVSGLGSNALGLIY